MMGKRLLSVSILFVFSMMAASPLLVTVVVNERAEHESSVLHHDDGVPCPDGDSEGACDDGCPCFCCPGHVTMIFTSSGMLFVNIPRTESHRLESPDTLHPKDDFRRIFRPPRA